MWGNGIDQEYGVIQGDGGGDSLQLLLVKGTNRERSNGSSSIVLGNINR